MKLHISEPNSRQELFLKSRTKYVAFGGARGGGKSWAVRTKAKLLALGYKGIQILIVRRTYPELIRNHIRTLKKELLGIAKYNDKDKILTFKNGSSIQFMYCKRDSDLDALQGAEFDVICLDEATQLSEYQMKMITACLRGVNSFPKHVYFTCNPGGQGHQYIRRVFIKKKYEEGEIAEDYTFIQSLVTDNKALMRENPDYIQQLEALPPKLKEAWLYGNWDIFEGQYFEDFKETPDMELCAKLGLTVEEAKRQHRCVHVIEPFEIPKHWTIYRSFDWGYAKPFSCGWWAVSDDGVAYRILEWYGCTKTPNEGLRMIPQQVFKEIHRIETEHDWLKGKKIYGYADPAIWNAETGESIEETARKNGVYFDKGDNSRIAGWLQLHYRFAFDKHGKAMMYIFSNCKDFIRTMPLLMYDDHKVEDLDTDGEDHAADDARYFAMARPIKPRITTETDPYYLSPMNTALDIPKENILPYEDDTTIFTIKEIE